MPKFYAGIDWSDDKHDVVVLDEAASRVGEREVKHTVKGLNELNNFLQTPKSVCVCKRLMAHASSDL